MLKRVLIILSVETSELGRAQPGMGFALSHLLAQRTSDQLFNLISSCENGEKKYTLKGLGCLSA